MIKKSVVFEKRRGGRDFNRESTLIQEGKYRTKGLTSWSTITNCLGEEKKGRGNNLFRNYAVRQ